VVLWNIQSMSVTIDVSQPPMAASKAVTPVNV
jgi:hypothetical protein